MKSMVAIAAMLLVPLAAQAQTIPGKAPMVGGWVNVPDDTKEAAPIPDVAVWAFNQLDLPGAELADFDNVSQQVAAGMNYRMDLITMDGERWRVQVYRRFDGQMQLTSSEKIEPSEDETGGYEAPQGN